MDDLSVVILFLPFIASGVVISLIVLYYLYRYRNMTIPQIMVNTPPDSPEFIYTPPQPSAPPEI